MLLNHHFNVEIAEHLGFSYQRVANWKRRGIPYKVIVEKKLLGVEIHSVLYTICEIIVK